jgi:hypothetical protein
MTVLERPASLLDRYLKLGTGTRRAAYSQLRAAASRLHVRERRRLARSDEVAAGFDVTRLTGYKSLSPGELGGVDGVISASLAAVGQADLRTQKKSQLLTGLVDSASLDAESPFIQLALRDDVLGTVTRYLGVVPVLDYVDVWYSRWTDALKNSQLFHCDWADTKQVKLFVFCTDIAMEDGPLVVIDAAASETLRRRVRYRFGGPRCRISDEDMQRHLGDGAARALTGPKGSAAFVDTSRCFHQGSRLASDQHERVVAVFQYLTPAAFCIRSRSSGGPFSAIDATGLTRLQRLVLRTDGVLEALRE